MAENIPPVNQPNAAERDSVNAQTAPSMARSPIAPTSWPVSVTILSVLYLGALLASLLLFIATLNTWETVAKSEEIAQSVQEIEQFEKRVSERLDVFNAGIQTLIQDSNNRIFALENTMRKSEGQQKELIDDLRRLADALEQRVFTGATSNVLPESSQAPAVSQPAVRSVNRSRSDSNANPTPGFRRIDNGDGSVSYEKIN